MSDSECVFTLSPCNSTVTSFWQLVVLVSNVTEVKKQLLSIVNIRTADGEKVRLDTHTTNTLDLKFLQGLLAENGYRMGWKQWLLEVITPGFWTGSPKVAVGRWWPSGVALLSVSPNGEFFLVLIAGCYKVLWGVYISIWMELHKKKIHLLIRLSGNVHNYSSKKLSSAGRSQIIQ